MIGIGDLKHRMVQSIGLADLASLKLIAAKAETVKPLGPVPKQMASL
jgi:hypothetical protein